LLLFPGNYPLTRYYAELALLEGRPAQAAEALDEALQRRPDEPSLFKLRAEAAANTGNRAEAHLYLAESHVLDGQLETAVQQLEVAVRDEKLNFYEGAKLQAKLREIKRELKSEREAEKNSP
jgi:predicted Zn-dependent protease